MVYKAFKSGFFATTDKSFLTVLVGKVHLDKIDLIKNTPGIFQEYIPKLLELRITVIGRKVFATEIHSQEHEQAEHDWRGGKIDKIFHCPHELPKSIEAMCLKFVEYFDLTFGAIDMILTPDGKYIFLENNPSGQFGWIEGRTNVPLTATLATMLIAGRIL